MSTQIIGSVPTCPTCKRTVYSGDVTVNDGEETTVDCDGCGRTYRVRLEVTYDYVCDAVDIRAAEQARREKEEKNG